MMCRSAQKVDWQLSASLAKDGGEYKRIEIVKNKKLRVFLSFLSQYSIERRTYGGSIGRTTSATSTIAGGSDAVCVCVSERKGKEGNG